jgi:hypothetical protein
LVFFHWEMHGGIFQSSWSWGVSLRGGECSTGTGASPPALGTLTQESIGVHGNERGFVFCFGEGCWVEQHPYLLVHELGRLEKIAGSVDHPEDAHLQLQTPNKKAAFVCQARKIKNALQAAHG